MDQSELTSALRKFADERDWEQFHTPKNLVMALTGEAGELAEVFQWLTPAESASVMDDAAAAERVRDELADIYGYLLRLADVLGVSLDEALQQKMEKNAARYTIDASRGNARKAPHAR